MERICSGGFYGEVRRKVVGRLSRDLRRGNREEISGGDFGYHGAKRLKRDFGGLEMGMMEIEEESRERGEERE